MDRSVLLAFLTALAVFVFVLELVRRRKLGEDYSLLWLATAAAMIVLALWRDLLHGLAALVGIAYPPNLLFLAAALFSFLILLVITIVLTRLTRENKHAAQQIALLREEIRALREQMEDGPKGS